MTEDDKIKNLFLSALGDLASYESVTKDYTFSQKRSYLRGVFENVVIAYGSATMEKAIEDHLRINIDKIKGEIGSMRPTLSSLKQHMSNQALEGFCLWAVRDYGLRGFGESRDRAIDHLKSVANSMMDAKGYAEWKGKPSRGLTKASLKMLVLDDNKYRALNAVLNGDKTIAIPTEKETTTMTTPATTSAMRIDLSEGHKNAVNALLAIDCGLSIDDINNRLGQMDADLATAKEEVISARALAASATAITVPKHVESDGTVPSGTCELKDAWGVFGDQIDGQFENLFKFDAPYFEWDGVHPDVPTVDANYKFDPLVLYRVLQGFVGGDNTYLYGHTGTGKSTMVEQVCARLNYPLVRVNFDSEISRMDLVGRDTLVSVDGVTESKFVDGVVPDALARPCVLLCDEVDFIRPDVMYVFQRVLEGNGLLITEDGGRKVVPDPMFRLIATANTVGQGDDTSMYQGARPQSMATLDRFENWAEMKYMKPDVEKKWLRGVTAGLTDKDAATFVKYAKEHREAFMGGKVLQPLSPRGLKAMAKRFVVTNGLTGDVKGALEEAMQATILDRCTKQDKAVLEGLVQRVIK